MKNKDLNCSVGKQYPYQEKVSGKKFVSGMFNFLNPVLWLKDLSSLFNIRKIIIALLIVAGFFVYGYVKGQSGRPVEFDIGRYEEAVIKLNGEQLHIYKNGEVWIEDFKTKEKIKQILVKDIPLLKSKLAPIKLKLSPIIVAGYGVSDKGTSQAEVGIGVSFLEYWKMSLEAFLTQVGAYVGTSYRITDNTSAGIALGKGYKDFDTRILLYGRIKF